MQAGMCNQAANTVVLNASGASVTGATASAFFVAPVRSQSVAGAILISYDVTTSEIYRNTAKTFVIDHPINKNNYLVHGCLEGPEVGVYYRGQAEFQDDEKETQVRLPNYVEALASQFTVNVTSIKSDEINNINILEVSEVKNNLFTVYKHSLNNNYKKSKFNWIVHGKRSSIETEINKSSVIVKGDGPYRYIEKYIR